MRLNHPDPAIVMLLQRRLNQLGCWPSIDAKGKTVPLNADGDFGQLTASAVKLFQARSFDSEGKPLSVDGVVALTTWSALFGTPNVAPVTATVPPQGLLRRVITVAANEEQQHVREQPLGSNRGPRVDQYLRAAGHRSEHRQLSVVCGLHRLVLRQRGAPAGACLAGAAHRRRARHVAEGRPGRLPAHPARCRDR